MSTRGDRYAAKMRGDTLYRTARPCKQGHTSDRRVSTGTCLECQRSQDYLRTATNREAYNARKQRERQPILAKLAAKAQIARDMESAEQRAARLADSRKRSHIWRLSNPQHEGTKISKRKYVKSAKGGARAVYNGAIRRAAALQRIPAWLTVDDIWFMNEIYHLAKVRSDATGIMWHVDHIIPMQGKYVSGLHTPSNLQVLTQRDNTRKGNKYDPDTVQAPKINANKYLPK